MLDNKDLIILDSIDFKVNVQELLKRLHMDEDSDDLEDIIKFAELASEIGRPKAMYKEAIIDLKGDDYVVVDGVKFKSRLVRVNLDSVDRVFPYVCTCGRELNEWAKSLDDMLEQYWVDRIMEMALQEAVKAFEDHLETNYKLGTTSNMNPGSLEDWPISQQEELFALLEDPYEKIGVELTDSCLMLPIKSLSGIRFSSDIDFVNCQLCPRERCENRRAEYDHHLYNKRYKD